MRFEEIVGQEVIKRRLLGDVERGRIPHALLISGQRGVGKFQLALALAQYICCENKQDGDSCGECRVCNQFKKLAYPDLYFVFPVVKSDAGEVSDDFIRLFREMVLEKKYFDIDDWHAKLGAENKQSMIMEKESGEIIKKVSIKPFFNNYKIFIIWCPERMNATCANKLLKILEEPYANTLFFLVSEEPDLLLPTIISRCQPLRVPPLSSQEISAALVQRGVGEQQAHDIAHIAQGSFLKALRMSESQQENNTFFEQFKKLMRNAWRVAERREYDALIELRKWSSEIADSKVGREQQCQFLQYCQQTLRENYIFNFKEESLNYQMSEEREFSVRFAAYITANNVEKMMNLFSLSEERIRRNGSAKMIFFSLCLQIIILIKKR